MKKVLFLFHLQVKLKDMGTVNKKLKKNYSIAEEEGSLDLLPHLFCFILFVHSSVGNLIVAFQIRLV